MRNRIYAVLLRVYRKLPTLPRRWAVRAISPKFTVGAICFIERPDGALLLVRTAYRERWGVPGGLLKRGEESADAARREVLEEVGLAVELIGEPAVVLDARPQRIDIVYRARPARHADIGSVRPSSVEIEEVRWFAPDQLPELQFETAGALIALGRATVGDDGPPAWFNPEIDDRGPGTDR
jgi:8-oxo-dGTP pyrophosphatase MutT (NUDIX family)